MQRIKALNWKCYTIERVQFKSKNVDDKQDGSAVAGTRRKKNLSREFWYMSVCVGSNSTPVRNRFRRDEAVSSADKFPHTKTRVGLNANPFRQTF